MVRLLLVRHGQSEWNVAGRVQGQAPGVGLTALGREQAAEAGRLLVGRGASRLYSSDLERAAETARIVGAAVGLPVRATPDLREQGLGELEGRLAAELAEEQVPPGQHLHEVRWGGGESVADLYARVARFAALVRADADTETVIVVSHAGPLQVLRTMLGGGGPRDVQWAAIPHAQVLEATLA